VEVVAACNPRFWGPIALTNSPDHLSLMTRVDPDDSAGHGGGWVFVDDRPGGRGAASWLDGVELVVGAADGAARVSVPVRTGTSHPKGWLATTPRRTEVDTGARLVPASPPPCGWRGGVGPRVVRGRLG